MKQRRTFGQYTAVLGKLDKDDARSAYVTGPTLTGRIAPIASFWNYHDAVRYAQQRHKEATETVKGVI